MSNPCVCTIIPPHISRRIVENGTPAQRARAEVSLAMTGQLRGFRDIALNLTVNPVAGFRRVYSADFGSDLPGNLIRTDGVPSVGDVTADEAYEGSGATYQYYFDNHNRNSINDDGMDLVSTVHFLKGYDNAFWNGLQMVYGDGDEDLPVEHRLFNRFTIAPDVIAHELTHGVIQHEADLTYAFQSGALNESFADVFGILVKQQRLGLDVKQSDWVIGAGLFTANIQGDGIRNMQAPGTAYDDPLLGRDPQPAHMDGYQVYPYDSGGVHINSGIPNHAFYRTAYEIGGFAWHKAGQIWYEALRQLDSNSNFQQAANMTYGVAGNLYGVLSFEQQCVARGWAAVGITVDQPPGCLPLARIANFLR